MRRSESAGGRCEVHLRGVRSVPAAVDVEPIDRYASTDAIAAASDAIGNPDDPATVDVVFVLRGR